MNSTPSGLIQPHRAYCAAVLAFVCFAIMGCTSSSLKKHKTSPPQAIGQLTTHRHGDEERAVRLAQDWLWEEKLEDAYDVRSATVRRTGNRWEVCFMPRNGPLKTLRRRCIEFEL